MNDLFIVFLIAFLIIILGRELIGWYLKTNEISKTLTEIRDILKDDKNEG